MNRPSCARTWEIEADGDARLTAVDRERLARHVSRCPECRVARDRLAALREAGRAPRDAVLAPLVARRLRASILRATLDPDAPGVTTIPPRVRAVTVALGTLVLAIAVAIVGVHRALGVHARVGPTDDPLATIVPQGLAAWSRSVGPTQELVTLNDGALLVSVPHQRPGHRFVIRVPDGTVEVRGTRFVVRVSQGRLWRVDVTEGRVAVQVVGGPQRLVAAGDTWERSEREPGAMVQAPPALPGGTATVHADGLADMAVVPGAGHAMANPVRVRPRGAPSATATVFADGLRDLDRGDFAAAARAFGTVETDHPRADQAEDAGWLRVVALRRAGQQDRAVAAARDYLGRYAHGLRRWETARGVAQDALRQGRCETARAVLAEFATVPGHRAEIDALVASCPP